MQMYLNGLNPLEYMFMYKSGDLYALKNKDTREYVFFKGSKRVASQFDAWLMDISKDTKQQTFGNKAN